MSDTKSKRKTIVSSSLIALLILFAVFMSGYCTLFLVANHLNYIWPVCHVQRVIHVVVGLFSGDTAMLSQGIFIVLFALILLGLLIFGAVHSAKTKRLNAVLPMIALVPGFLAVVDVIACMTRDYDDFGGYVYLIAGTPDLPNETINTTRLLVGIGIIATAFIACFIALVAYGTAIKDQIVEVKATEAKKERNARLEETFRRIVREELEAYFANHEQPVAEETAPVEETPVEEPAPVEETPVEEPTPVIEEPIIVPAGDEEEGATKIERIPFSTRIKDADELLKYNYNVIKSELLSYGLKSRISNAGDTFRLHRKTYARLTVAGKGLKLYFALDPKAYADSTIPVQDVSHKNIYAEIPLAFKVKSDLSVKRCKQLISDMMAAEGFEQQEVEVLDWVSHIEDVQADEEE